MNAPGSMFPVKRRGLLLVCFAFSRALIDF